MRPGNPEALSQPYDPVRIEPALYRFWEEHGVFQPRETGKDPFVIAIPPPNVTGSLTMGHVLGESIREDGLEHETHPRVLRSRALAG